MARSLTPPLGGSHMTFGGLSGAWRAPHGPPVALARRRVECRIATEQILRRFNLPSNLMRHSQQGQVSAVPDGVTPEPTSLRPQSAASEH